MEEELDQEDLLEEKENESSRSENDSERRSPNRREEKKLTTSLKFNFGASQSKSGAF